jgi:flagellar basal-body rod protein FlgC
MSLNRAFDIGSLGLSAQRTRMETVASNLANARTTRTPEGGPYKRIAPVFVVTPVAENAALRGVRVTEIVEDPSPPVLRFEPGHPDADVEGYVRYPNVDPVKEMVDMLSATRSYEANVTLIKSVRGMLQSALQILS